jgi:hypothetical protein
MEMIEGFKIRLFINCISILSYKLLIINLYLYMVVLSHYI